MRRLIILALALFGMPGAAFAQAVVAAPANTPKGEPDYANARPFPLPTVSRLRPERATAPAAAPSGPPIVSGGAVGDGTLRMVRLAPAQSLSSTGAGDVSPQQLGSANRPFSTARVSSTPRTTVPAQQPTELSYPFRAAGKLFVTDGGTTFFCSGALIGRGLVVTAAHCVAPRGQNRFYSNIRFVPAYRNGLAPFGTWSGLVFVPLSYLAGDAANCAVGGVICDNDVALIRLDPQGGNFPGTATGSFAYAANGWGFTTTTPNKTLINELGYPIALDNGQIMQRNGSEGERSRANLDNTIIGSLMAGGSDGGPWVNNLGIAPVLNGTGFGRFAQPNVVVGVTSWSNAAVKEQGASRFTSANILTLFNTACGSPTIVWTACLP